MGFSDASVLGYPDTSGSFYWLITVIEPEDSARVEYLPVPTLSTPTPSDWREFAMFIDSHGMAEQQGIRSYGQFAAGNRDSASAIVAESNRRMAMYGRGSAYAVEDARTIWEFLHAHRSAADHDQALASLKNDRDRTNRRIAALILSNFPEDDAVWHALLDAQRDGDRTQRVGLAATEVLQLFMTNYARKIDWRPAAKSIRAFLAGTNLFAFSETIVLLTKTEIDPAVAEPVLTGNADLVIAYLHVKRPEARSDVQSFVAMISGKPDADIDTQVAWLQQFQR
jgi:hypothetical protein